MALIFSELTPEEQVAAIFIGYYDRAPAVPGLNQYVADFAAGQTPADVARSFVMQDETLALYPSLAEDEITEDDAIALVTNIFLNLFNREPSNLGPDNFWVNKLLTEEGVEVGQIILDIMSGAEGGDLAILQNKIAVATAYVEAAVEVGDDGTGALKGTILDDVDGTQDSVVAAITAISEAFPNIVPGNEDIFLTGPSSQENGIDVTGVGDILPTAGNDIFNAEDGTLNSADRLDGGTGLDTLMVFNQSDNVAVSPRTTSIEQVVFTNQANDLFSVADNNVGGYDFNADTLVDDGTTMVDVEIDAGRMVGVDRWEDFDSRADVVIEDARDDDDTDGTFTANITVAMVSTDPGNVDYAVYFDGPVNQSSDSGVITLQILDQENANTIAGSGNSPFNNASVLEENFYSGVSFDLANGANIIAYELDIAPEDLEAANASYSAYAAALQAVADANNVPVTITLGNEFTISDAAGVFKTGVEILIETNESFTVVDDSVGFIVSEGAETGGSDIFFNPISSNLQSTDLITLNVELDDVGKGSMGGDAMFGAMSTGRQEGDDGTSDSIGIEKFDITVDRSSKLQTINSTNNALQVVTIASGVNSNAITNTTTASDEAAGDLVVRGVANPGVEFDTTVTSFEVGAFDIVNAAGQPAIGNTASGVATDGLMPGAAPQHNAYGFSDVRVIDASSMTGVQADDSVASVDLTAELTEEIVEKYLKIQDVDPDGEADDRDFAYTLGGGDDEFFLNMSSDALNAAGTGSREDFDMNISGGAGADVITTNIGQSLKVIDEQGQDHYAMATENGTGSASWYTNAVSNVAAEMSVNGGAGADTIWTHGWGDFTIDGGADADVIYTDNSGAEEASLRLATNIDRNLEEHDPIDYVVGGVWAFNGDNIAVDGTTGALSMTGATNDTITLGTVTGASTTTPFTATSGQAVFTLTYFGAAGLASGAGYNINITIPFSELTVNSTTGVVTASEQALNQAIKAGINGDAILSNLLEAADGPGNSLLVATKTDGSHAFGDLALTYGGTNALTINNNAPLTLNAAAITGNAGYVPAATNFINLGAASEAESDNLIKSGSDGANDLIVLSTNDGGVTQPTVTGALLAPTDLNGASNEVIEFDNGFGRDTVLNFDIGDGAAATAPNGEDVLDFDFLFADNTFAASTLSGTFSAAVQNGQVEVVAEIGGTGPTSNDTLAEIQALYTAADTTATVGTPAEEILIVYDVADDNAGAVYSIVNGNGVGDVQVAFEGTINLIGTAWTALTIDNFA